MITDHSIENALVVQLETRKVMITDHSIENALVVQLKTREVMITDHSHILTRFCKKGCDVNSRINLYMMTLASSKLPRNSFANMLRTT